MDLKKATMVGVLVWFIVFVAASIVMYTISMEMIGIVCIFVIPIVTVTLAKYLYLDKVKPGFPAREGVLLGAYWLILVLILDVIVIVVGFGAGSEYFTEANWTMPVGYAEFVVAGYIAGLTAKK